jgi:hypothetical protein
MGSDSDTMSYNEGGSHNGKQEVVYYSPDMRKYNIVSDNSARGICYIILVNFNIPIGCLHI